MGARQGPRCRAAVQAWVWEGDGGRALQTPVFAEFHSMEKQR